MLLIGSGFNVAVAQEDDRAAPGDTVGFNVNGFKLTPRTFVEILYDSNVFNQADTETDDLSDSLLVIPGAEFNVTTLNPRDVDLQISSMARGEIYTIGEDAVTSQTGFETSLDASAAIGPSNTVVWTPLASYTRNNRPQFAATNESYNENIVGGGLDVDIRPSGGQIFSQRIGYRVDYYTLEQIGDLDRINNTLESTTRWNFLPQTGLLLEIRQSFINYFDENRDTAGGATTVNLANVNSTPFRAMIGIAGLMFNRIDFALKLGYGDRIDLFFQYAHGFDPELGLDYFRAVVARQF